MIIALDNVRDTNNYIKFNNVDFKNNYGNILYHIYPNESNTFISFIHNQIIQIVLLN